MPLPDDLLAILARIVNGKHTDADLEVLRQVLIVNSAQNVVQIGKYTVNIGQGQDIRIGDQTIYQGADAETIREVFRSVLQEMQILDQPPATLPPLSPEAQKEAVCQFLQDIEDNFKYVRLFHTQQQIVLKEQYIPIQVTLERKYKHEVETTWGYAEDETQLKRIYALKKVDEESRRTQVDWEEAKKQYQKIIVLADPGMGKSTLLRMEAGSTAQKEREKLLNKEITIDEVVFPLSIRLSELDKRAEKIIDAISILIEEDYPETLPAVNNLLKEKLSNGKCLLLFDALDEVPKARRIDLAEKLNRFVRNYRGQIICTSRIVGYGGAFVEGAKEVEIVPFSQKQTEEYIKIWFKNATGYIEDDSISAEELIQELRNKPQIGGLAQNPLLLSLLCSLYQEKGLTLPARRCQVYAKAVEYMLGKWGIENRRQSPNEARVSAKKQLLEELAYQFSCEGKEIFSMDELTSNIENYLRSEDVRSDFRNLSASSLIWELSEQDGILQKLARNGDNYLFLHRTFQEYFTACYLKKANNSITLAREHFWEYDWHETLSLMAGLMLDPIPLLQAIIEEKEDRFFSLLLLAAQCVTECERKYDFLTINIFNKFFRLWCCYPSIDFIRRAVVKLIRSNPNILNRLLQKGLKKSSREINCETVRILGEINTVQVVEPLIQLLNNQDSYVRRWSVVALGKIGGAQAIEALVKARNDPNIHVRKWVFNILVKNSSPQIVNALTKEIVYSTEYIVNAFNIDELEKCNRFDFYYSNTNELFSRGIYNLLFLRELIQSLDFLYSDVRKETVIALGEIGAPQVIEVLIHILHPLDSDIKLWAVAASEKFSNAPPVETLIQSLTKTLYCLCSDVRKEAAVALGKIGNPRAVKVLSEALNDPESSVRREATIALGKIGDPKAVEVLSKAFNDPESNVRREAAVALGATASSQALKTLIKALDDQDNDVRWWVAAALGEISNPKAIELLIQALNCPDSDVRREATVALGKIGSSKAVEVLIQALNNPNTEARRWAAVALAKVRWSANILQETKNVQVFEALMHAVDDSDSYIRRWAVVALGRIRHSRAVEALIQALNDSDSDVRKHAAIALGRIRNPRAVEALIQALNDSDSDVKKHAAVALGRIRAPQAVKELIRILNSPNNAIRMWFAVTLIRIQWTLYACGRIRNLQVIEVLVQALDPPDTELRWRAASALGEIGGAQAVKGLIRSLSDPNSDIRGLSAAALGKIGDSLAIRALVQALSHPDKEVKKEAVEALKQISGAEALKYLIQYPEIDLYDPDILPLARTLVIRAKTTQGKTLFVSIFPKKLKLIDRFSILYRQLSRFFV